MQVDKSFTAVGVSSEFTMAPGRTMTYSLSGTFVQTVILERAVDGTGAWVPLVTATAAASGTVRNETTGDVRYRWRCKARTSGTAVTTMADTNTDAERRVVSAAGQGKAGTTSGWVVAAADNIALVTCPASKTASTLVVPLPQLKVGERIVGFHLVGQIESAANTVTVDANLRKHTAAAADVADASVASITQLSVVADTAMSRTNTAKGALDVIVAEDESYYVLITATTGASTDIALQSVVLDVLPK